MAFALRSGSGEVYYTTDGELASRMTDVGYVLIAQGEAAEQYRAGGPAGPGGPQMVQPGSPADFYGDNISYATPYAASPAVGAGALILGLTGILARLGPLAGTFWQLVKSVVAIPAVGTVLRIPGHVWSILPGPVRSILTGLGFVEGLDMLIDIDGQGPDVGLIPFGPGLPSLFGGQDLVPGLPNEYEQSLFSALGLPMGGSALGGGIVQVWNTNKRHPEDGTWFVRLADGRGAARKKSGVWRIFRYKKPIVIFAGGAEDLRTMLRADRALNAQALRLRRTLDRRAPKPRRAPKKPG